MKISKFNYNINFLLTKCHHHLVVKFKFHFPYFPCIRHSTFNIEINISTSGVSVNARAKDPQFVSGWERRLKSLYNVIDLVFRKSDILHFEASFIK